MSRRQRKSKRSHVPHESRVSKVGHEPVATPPALPPVPSHSALKGWLLIGLASSVMGLGIYWFQAWFPHALDGVPAKMNRTGGVATGISTSGIETGGTNLPLEMLNTASVKEAQVVAQSQLDPGQDGWETEVVAELAKKQLIRLGERLVNHHRDKDWFNSLQTEVAAEVTCGRMRPAELVEVFRDGVDDQKILVRRAANSDQRVEKYQGRADLMRAMDELAEPFASARDVHIHVKVIRVTSTADKAETMAYFEADGRTPTGFLQQRVTWHCQWQRSGQGMLLLTSIRATDYEEAIKNGPWLVDCTASVLDKNDSFREQLAFGLNHWLSRLGRVHGMHAFARSGLAVGDVNGDGLDDVYVSQPGGLPNRLFVQQSDGTAIDRSHEAGVDWFDQTSSTLIVDLDNDGDQDLIAATRAGLLLMENDGTGKFRLRTTLATRDNDTQSFSAADYDNDGDLDLYVCIEFANQMSLQKVAFVYHDANDGAANRLFRNDIGTDGKWQFTEVTQQVGLDVDNRRHSLACAWEDYDNDGDQDLYVANDYGQNCLYQNEGGQFKNIALEANVVDSASGMSVSWADYNRDGWMDLYVANMFSSAGNRITRQEQFKTGADDQLRKIYSRFAKGNTLLQNDGHGQFREVSESLGVEMGRWAWSSVFADMNNDAWDDLLVANGYISTEDSGDL
ncbi:MAG: VCBS repeat-containing protein [Pirellulales bacterium]